MDDIHKIYMWPSCLKGYDQLSPLAGHLGIFFHGYHNRNEPGRLDTDGCHRNQSRAAHLDVIVVVDYK